MKIFENRFNLIFILVLILIISFLVGNRSYHTKILPFQSFTLICEMNGKQKFPPNGGVKYAPIVKFPKIFKIKFGFWDGEFIQGGDVLIKKDFFKKKTFGYQYSGHMLIIEPTYKPDWIKDGDPPGNSMQLQFVGGKGKELSTMLIDYFYPGDYDAIYKCNNPA